MIESENPICLEHFDEITGVLSKDLCWYLVYEAALNASESLHIEGNPDLPENKRRLYHFATSVEMKRLLEEHVFEGCAVEISHAFYEEAMHYFAMNVPGESMSELSGYLNYLDSWSQVCGDWKRTKPAAYDSLEIAIAL